MDEWYDIFSVTDRTWEQQTSRSEGLKSAKEDLAALVVLTMLCVCKESTTLTSTKLGTG